MMIFLLLAIVAVLGAARAITVLEAARIEAAHPASGRLVEVEGGKLHVLELGASTPQDQLPIVLVHGASGNLQDLRLALGDRLAANRRVILVDRPGHGWSDRPGGVADASPARQAALIAEALGRIGVARFVLLGHSLGGAVASALALAFPARVAGLVLLAPVTHPWEGGLAWYNAILSTPFIGPLFARTVAFPLSVLLLNGGVASVFAPQAAPADYVRRAATRLLQQTTVGGPSAPRTFHFQDKQPATQPSPHHADLVGTRPAGFDSLPRTPTPGIYKPPVSESTE